MQVRLRGASNPGKAKQSDVPGAPRYLILIKRQESVNHMVGESVQR